MTTGRQYYDPAHLVREIRELLHAQGREPGPVTSEARTATSMLLRALNITPAMDGVEALIRAMDKPWVEADDQVAECMDSL